MYYNAFHVEDLSKYQFLVTGGAGFIGSHLVEYLLQHKAGKVRVLDDLSTGFQQNLASFANNPQLEFINGSICNVQTCQQACRNIDFVFHEAALGSVPRSIKDPATTNAVNIDGFLNMLVAAKDNQVKRFVYAASSSVYGDSQELPKVEARIGKPLSPYAVTKLVNELYADVFAKTYGLEVIGLRYFNVFGPRQSPKGAYAAVIPLFIQALLENKQPTMYGDGEQTRDFTFVENVVQANIKALFSPIVSTNQVYNIAVGESTSLNQLFYYIQQLAKSSITPQYVPERSGDIRNSLADISKAQTLLGYSPKVRIKEGLQRTFEWFTQL
ncbi:SDR family oxidoreductase [Rhodocytophaga aerolata]|uniref:SDR family oxidoreductase n=1 Tax=Rhodocytophaga aerolata TaxID=455078 RepID=A0ABT8RDE4_9BACT|nr:SDR family oxidoreductase [Rhodocytophaga aerolata]MDO1450112.1 SDR family oxidoreductase [Rhodocytophaga aerolata]